MQQNTKLESTVRFLFSSGRVYRSHASGPVAGHNLTSGGKAVSEGSDTLEGEEEASTGRALGVHDDVLSEGGTEIVGVSESKASRCTGPTVRMPKYGVFMKWTRQIPSIEFFWSSQPFASSSGRWGSSSSSGGPSSEAEALASMSSLSMDDTEQEVMDEKLWSNLPPELVEKVVARLPIAVIFRLRVVCKRWNGLVSTARFVALRENVSCVTPWFILCTNGTSTMPVYNTSAEKWHCLPIPSDAPATGVVAASVSLLCFGDQIGECSSLTVCNPVTKILRELPCMPSIRLIHKVGMLADPGTKGYQIVVVGESVMDGDQYAADHVYDLITEVYDSRTNSWATGGVTLETAKFGTDPGAWKNGIFYCITEMPYGVVLYDLVRSAWREVGAPMPANLVCPALAEAQGRLLMVGKVLDTSSGPPRSQSIVLWELLEEQREWVEVTRVPSAITLEFLESVHYYRTHFVCAVLGSNICLTTHQSPHCLVYDMNRKLWKWLPRDPLFPRFRNGHLMGFALEPRLDWTP